MSSITSQRVAECFMALADIGERRGWHGWAADCCRRAAWHQMYAYAHVPETRPRTRAVLAGSIMALADRAARLEGMTV